MKQDKVRQVSFEELKKRVRDAQKQPTKSRWLFTQNVKGNKEVNFHRDERGVWWTGNWPGQPRETEMIAHWVVDDRRLYVGARSSLPAKPAGTTAKGVVRYAIAMEGVEIFQVAETGPAVTYSALLEPEGSANGRQGYLYWPDPAQLVLDAVAQVLDGTSSDLDQQQVNEIQREVWCRTSAHARFKGNLHKRWGGRCALTGVDIQPLLVASHIKPWAACKATPHEQISVDNGLLLLSPIDKLFDRGFMSFGVDGEILLHKKGHGRHLPPVALAAFGLNVKPSLRIQKSLPQQTLEFLEIHRKTVFHRH